MTKRWLVIITAMVLITGLVSAGTYVYANRIIPSVDEINAMTDVEKNKLGSELTSEQLKSMSIEQLRAIEPAAGDPNEGVIAENENDPNAASSFSSGVGGKLSPSARKAIEDPKNKGKWIGMKKGPDGLFYVDRVQDQPSK